MSEQLESIDRYYTLYKFYNNLIISTKSSLESLKKDEKKMKELEERFNSLKEENELQTFLSKTAKEDLVYIREKAYLDALITSKKDIIKSFKNSTCYPFSKTFHFFIENKNIIICVITDESTKGLSKEHKRFCKDVILESGELIYECYSKKDIPQIKDLYKDALTSKEDNIHQYILTKSRKK